MINAESIKLTKDNLILILVASAIIGIGISYGNLYLFHLILGIVGFIWIYQLKKNLYKLNLNIFSSNYVYPLLLIFSWYVLSILWAPDFILAIKYVFYIFCGLTITINIIYFTKTTNKLNQIFNILSVVFMIELLIALFESFTSFRMPISSYSSIAHYFGKEPIEFFGYKDIIFYSAFTPPTGFHWNTNNLAISMILILPFFLCSKKITIKIIGIVTITAITIMTASRAVFLGLILIYCLYLIVIKKKIGTLILLWLIVAGLFWGMLQLRESENPRLNELANSIEALSLYLKGDIDIGGSIEWRRNLVDNGLKALSETYGFGLGAGGSTANQEMIGPVAGRFTSMHNFWVEVLVEGGVLFAIIMLLWYCSLIYNLFLVSKSKLSKELNYYGQSLFLSMIAFIPSAIAASSTIYFFPMWIMFGFTISVILIYKKEKNNFPLIRK